LAGERAAPPPAVQPVDLALAEQSPRARRQLDAAIDHWVTVLGRHPARALPPRDSPYRRHHHVILRSPEAGDVLTRRAPCAPSSVLLAALARAIDRRYGSAEGVLHVLCANRQQPETAHYIGTISQETLVGYRIPPGACLTQTSRVLHASALRAYRRGRYDHERLTRTIAELGIVRHRDVVINNISGYPGAGPGPGPRLETSTGPEDTPLTLTVYELAPRLVCKLSVDERYLNAAQAREFLAEIEEELLSMGGVS
ncbi:MAG: hypothetical protein HOV86_30560, partial [Thermoactinospora sp.]|nr:hypothetical protein [Thermoactinospora sp.]